MGIKGLTVSGGRVYQEIDLADMFGVSFEGQDALKLAVCQEIVDRMVARSLDGKDHNGRSFAKYSSSYKKSDEFEAYGKSASDVNMQLTGDMLASIDFETNGNTVKFLFDDSEDEAKAYGHMSGMEGHPTIKDAPKRLFFGIGKDEIEKEILPKFKEDIDSIRAMSEEPEVTGGRSFMTLEQALGLGSGKTLEDLLREL